MRCRKSAHDGVRSDSYDGERVQAPAVRGARRAVISNGTSRVQGVVVMVHPPLAAIKRSRVRAGRVCSTLALVMLIVAMLARTGDAANSGKTITLGESLNDAQRAELLGYFGADSKDRVITV